jgi:FKBP-type peptidyl-prolyl cis-trans isomerase 2
MEPDESKTIRIPVAEAFEQHRRELVPTISQETHAADLLPNAGQKSQAIDANGRSTYLTVWDVPEQSTMIDVNHPLAGGDLTFDILLVEIV